MALHINKQKTQIIRFCMFYGRWFRYAHIVVIMSKGWPTFICSEINIYSQTCYYIKRECGSFWSRYQIIGNLGNSGIIISN